MARTNREEKTQLYMDIGEAREDAIVLGSFKAFCSSHSKPEERQRVRNILERSSNEIATTVSMFNDIQLDEHQSAFMLRLIHAFLNKSRIGNLLTSPLNGVCLWTRTIGVPYAGARLISMTMLIIKFHLSMLAMRSRTIYRCSVRDATRRRMRASTSK